MYFHLKNLLKLHPPGYLPPLTYPAAYFQKQTAAPEKNSVLLPAPLQLFLLLPEQPVPAAVPELLPLLHLSASLSVR